MKKLITILIIAACFAETYAQRMGLGTTSPHLSSILDITSTSGGFLLPRMNATQRGAIGMPAAGLMVYETTSNSIYLYNGTGWVPLGASTSQWSTSGNNIYNSNAGFVGIGTSTEFPERLTLRGDMMILNEGQGDEAELFFQGQTGPGADGGRITFLDPDTTSGSTIRYQPVYRVLGLTNDFAQYGSFYLYDNGNTGIGTLHNASVNSKLQIARGNDVVDYNDHGYLQLGLTHLENLVFGPTEILARDNGVSAPLKLQEEGGLVKIGTAGGIITTRLYVTNGYESSLTTHGHMVLGSVTSDNMVFDENEIQARINGAATILRLQQDGGALYVQGDALVVNNLGEVGIGTLGPDARLHVNGNTIIDGHATMNSTNPTLQLQNAGVDKGFVQLSGDNFRIGTNSANDNGMFVIRTNAMDQVFVNADGHMGIGTQPVDLHRLAVLGTVICEELKVELVADWPDYVFTKDYDLLPLQELKSFIDTHHHLPNIPNASEIQKDGLEVGEMNRKLLEKIEELTLYLIQQNERIDILTQRLNEKEH